MNERKTVLQWIDQLEIVFQEAITHFQEASAEKARLNARWKAAVIEMKREVGDHPVRMEHYVADLVGGDLTERNCVFDVLSPGGIKLEVKWSNLSKPSQNGYRWTWDRITGTSDQKHGHVDRLILIGAKPPNSKPGWFRDEASEFVIFDVPFNDVRSLVWNKEGGRNLIQLMANPQTVRKPASVRLFREFEVTSQMLTDRYGPKPMH
jgi:hypothetical protein